MHSNKIVWIFFIIIVSFLISCTKERKTSSQPKTTVQPKVETKQIETISALEQQPSKPLKYSYDGLSYRDPFIPISPEKIAKASLISKGEAKIPSLGVLQLKGFIVDRLEEVALFSSPYGSYILYNGKLYDNQNRLVKGFSGKIVFDKDKKNPKGVILVDEKNEYKEYVLSK
ncbi:MAG: hypothetical protein QXO21_05975 [Candidatus Anstonellales archaeon]